MSKEGQNHIKPTAPIYSLHNLHIQLSGFHTLSFYLSLRIKEI